MLGIACDWLELTDGLGHPEQVIVRDLEVYKPGVDSNKN